MEAAFVSNKPSLSERINVRMIAVMAVVLFLVGYPVYLYVSASWHQGVEDVGNGVKKVDLKSLGNYPFDETAGTLSDIPPKWRQLDGKKVILEGFMFSTDSAGDDVSTFQFVYNITKCCFNGPPKVQERVFAQVAHGGKVPYSSQEVRCSGELRVMVHKNEVGKTDIVYAMLVDHVEPI
jgi:hypothetical protein